LFNNSVWIGLNELNTAGGYVWSDGSPVNFGKIFKYYMLEMLT
jgi:hypothetical protein